MAPVGRPPNGKAPHHKVFVEHMASTGDKTYAATKAGLKKPEFAGWRLMQNPLIAEAVRDKAEKFLREKAGPAMVYNLANMALDENVPAGARVKASEILLKASGLAATDGEGGKDLHEMTADELRRELVRMEAKRNALERSLSDQAKPVLEHDNPPETSVFE